MSQVLVPGRGGHVYGGGPAAGGRPALPPPAERALLQGHRQAVRLRDRPGAPLPAQQAHHPQVRSRLLKQKRILFKIESLIKIQNIFSQIQLIASHSTLAVCSMCSSTFLAL